MPALIQYEKRLLLITSFLILLFAYTATSKLLDVRHFQAALYASPLLKPWVHPLSYILPSVELLTAVLLLIPYTRPAGLLLSGFLMLLFTGYVTYILFFTEKLPCSCGGVLQQMGWKTHLVLNALTTAVAFWAWRAASCKRFHWRDARVTGACRAKESTRRITT